MTRTDVVRDLPWSNVHVGQYVRFATPRFLKYGVVAVKRDNSMVILHRDGTRTTLPDARWYFVEGKKNPNAEEHLVVIEEMPEGTAMYLRPASTEPDTITVNQAIELLKMDPKQLRRHIRNGRIKAVKNKDDQWIMSRELLMESAAKYGWI